MEQNQESEFGDFEEIKEEPKKIPSKPGKPTKPGKFQTDEQFAPRRVRQPRKGQVIGLVIERLGGNRMSVKSIDGKTRNCRVPGRFKRRFWLRAGDPVIIEPWPDDDSKADIVHQYKKGEKFQILKSGILNSIKDKF
jgi:translation initiation factor 1A